jgi:predicted enzyme related to lactoylglutathione lyase
MSTAEASNQGATSDVTVGKVDLKLEVVVIPVSDVDRAKEFYGSLGWRLDADFADGDEFRIVQYEGAGGARFHDAGRVVGPSPDRGSYGSFATFSDPDGNGWLLQEITTRLPGRVDSAATSFTSVNDLASAMRRASAAHGEHEKRTGEADANWPDWYAAYMVAEQTGADLPT